MNARQIIRVTCDDCGLPVAIIAHLDSFRNPVLCISCRDIRVFKYIKDNHEDIKGMVYRRDG